MIFKSSLNQIIQYPGYIWISYTLGVKISSDFISRTVDRVLMRCGPPNLDDHSALVFAASEVNGPTLQHHCRLLQRWQPLTSVDSMTVLTHGHKLTRAPRWQIISNFLSSTCIRIVNSVVWWDRRAYIKHPPCVHHPPWDGKMCINFRAE